MDKEKRKELRKQLKKEARKNIKRNYFNSILVMAIVTFMISGGYTFTSIMTSNKDNSNNTTNNTVNQNAFSILNKMSTMNVLGDVIEIVRNEQNKESENTEQEKEEKKEMINGQLAPIVNKITKSQSAFFNFFQSFKLFFKGDIKAGINSLIAANIILFFFIFVQSVLVIGKSRYFLESRTYSKTKVTKILYPYQVKKTWRLGLIIFCKNIYQMLWNYTIIGGFIKHYEYYLIPYVLAENPTITRKEAFRLSKEMMKGLKWEMFKLELSFFGWNLLSLATFGFSDIFYVDAYKEFTIASYYEKIREEKKKELTDKEALKDDTLFQNKKGLGEYPEDKYIVPLRTFGIKTDYNQKYSFRNYILFFFTFSFIGWSWEVLLHLLSDGTFVNRGTLFGPWLPIYGAGGVLMLFLLKPFRNKPLRLFIMSILVAGVMEYATAWYLETFNHMKWWDYSGYFLNIHGRVCLEGLLVFGLAGMAATYFVGPILNSLYNKIKPKISIVICLILCILFGADFAYSSEHPNTGEGITSSAS